MANSLSWEDPHKLLQALQNEKHKIDAFKRELPLCIHLLNEAIERACLLVSTRQPVLEEFMPRNVAKTEQAPSQSRDEDDKRPAAANWQLWGYPEAENSSNMGRSLNGAFVPFVRPKNSELPAKLKDDLRLSPCSTGVASSEMVHLPSHQVPVSLEDDEQTRSQHFPRPGICINNNLGHSSYQQHRKSRRCWSPELHRRFVGALQQLGGPQVATPKQIRELMKVEGLTNDEVKSHLQKYRLHTRKPCGVSSPQTATSAAAAAAVQSPQVVVLGSIWMPTEYNTMLSPQNPQEARDFFASASTYREELEQYQHRIKNTSPSVEDEDVSYDGDLTEVEDSRSSELALRTIAI